MAILNNGKCKNVCLNRKKSLEELTPGLKAEIKPGFPLSLLVSGIERYSKP